jgi:hypothetical protein
MRPTSIALALLSLIPPGCGEASPRSAAFFSEQPSAVADRATAEVSGPRYETIEAPEPDSMAMMEGMMGARSSALAIQDAPSIDVDAAPMARKIIYDAQIDLIVEELDPAADQVAALVEEHDGYIADQDLSGSPGSRRSGNWKLRVPVERFEDLVRALLGLGELQRNRRSSQDVTEQFYDTEARLRNKKVEESTLLEILEERGGKLEDVLKVEVELSRVRGEIEQLEGRLRVLESLSSLATITLVVTEREDFEPPAPVAPSFGTKIARQWASSIDAMRAMGESLVLFSVGLAPWLPIILVVLAVVVLLLRRIARALPRLWEVARRPLLPPREPR